MTIREDLAACVEAGGTADEIARRIIGMFYWECSFDNGNGWYDDDQEFSEGDGMRDASRRWLSIKDPETLSALDRAGLA